MNEPLLRFFQVDYNQPEWIRSCDYLAQSLCETILPSAERTVALRKLLEVKDALQRCEVKK